MLVIKAFVVATALLAISTLQVHAVKLSGKAEAVDGDTIRLQGLSIRLNAIDAPEALQSCTDNTGKQWECGKASTSALARLLDRGTVSCEGDKYDRYRRLLAFCTVKGIDVNHWMVDHGWAFAFVKYDNQYLHLQRSAKSNAVGVWRGTVQAPWQWRRDRFNKAAQLRQGSNCIIKGNINRRKERVYHMPWQKFYHQTWISSGRGERWFCNEDEALEAGWRRSLR